MTIYETKKKASNNEYLVIRRYTLTKSYRNPSNRCHKKSTTFLYYVII